MKRHHIISQIWATWGRMFLHAKREWVLLNEQEGVFVFRKAQLFFILPMFCAMLFIGFCTSTIYNEFHFIYGLMRVMRQMLVYAGTYAILWFALPAISSHYLPALEKQPIRIILTYTYPLLFAVEMLVNLIPGFDLLYLLDFIAVYWTYEAICGNHQIYEDERLKATLIVVGSACSAIAVTVFFLKLCLPLL